MKIAYQDQIHKDNMIEYLRRLRKIDLSGEVDREYLSALYIMCINNELRRKCLPYVDLESMGIDLNTCLKEQDFSSGYNVLVRLASNLFNENNKVTPMELIRSLDSRFFEYAIQAILLRKFNGPLFENEL